MYVNQDINTPTFCGSYFERLLYPPALGCHFFFRHTYNSPRPIRNGAISLYVLTDEPCQLSLMV